VWIQLAVGMNRWLISVGGVGLGVVIYLVGVFVLKVPEIQTITSVVRRRLKIK